MRRNPGRGPTNLDLGNCIVLEKEKLKAKREKGVGTGEVG